MSYTKQSWQDGNVNSPYGPISAARLQHIEDGLDAVANGGSISAAQPMVFARKITGSRFVKAMVDQTVMSSPPTITAATAAKTGNTVLKDYSSPEFQVLGGTMVQTVSSTFRGPLAPSREDAVARATTSGWSIAFTHEGSQFDVYYFAANAGAGFRVWVNEQPYSASFYTGGDTSHRYANVDFGGVRARRRIVIETTNNGNPFLFGGIQIAPTDVVAPTVEYAPVRLFVLGDSYTLGQTGPANPEYAFPWTMGRLLGITDVWANGGAGTGVCNNNGGGSNGATYGERVATDLYPYSPDIVLIQGSTNDGSYGSAAVQAAATTLIQGIQSNLPNAVIFATGPLFPGNFTTNYTNVNTGMKAAAAACGVTFIDATSPALWSSGTGKTGNNRSVNDGVLNSTTTVTSATANFTAADVGKIITATGIPTGTKISSVTNSTTIVLSAAATQTASGVTLTITNQTGDGPADTYLSSDGVHPTQVGHANIAWRLATAIAAACGVPVG